MGERHSAAELQKNEQGGGVILKKEYTGKLCVAISFVLNLSMLFFFKYFNFVIDNLNAILEFCGLKIVTPGFDIILPVGISFYIFQALGYTVDVYRNDIKAERNFLKYALFVSFFPQLVAGPIERSKNLLTQIESMDKIRLFDYERVRNGMLLMLWGFFQKLMVADRIAMVVDCVFDNYTSYGFVELVSAAVLFSLQIYCDFGGYSNIAKGAAEVLGFRLMDNFRQPYLAKTIKEFWRRWHISLTTWFTDYLYIPLGGSRKGKRRQYLNIMIVFLCSGLWHGASWNFVVWGLIHGCYQVAGNIIGPVRNRSMQLPLFFSRIYGTAITFGLVSFAWIFFRADTIGQAIGFIQQMLRHRRLLPFVEMGLNQENWFILLVSIAVLLAVDILHECGLRLRSRIYGFPVIIRGFIYLVAVWSVIMFGIYGQEYDASQFIYFQF